MNAHDVINAYTKVGFESSTVAADPHRLILMLFEGALKAISNAKGEMQRNDIAAKGKSITHAIRIIGEGLHASLDKTAGGALAQDLSALYDYMVTRLFNANVKNDVFALNEVSHLLTELKEAWENIRPHHSLPAMQAQSSPDLQLVYARG
jgi:flagellar protein FliS